VADRWANWSNNALIGDLLIELKQVLPLYKRFGQYHAAGIKIVERLSKRNAAFVQFASVRLASSSPDILSTNQRCRNV